MAPKHFKSNSLLLQLKFVAGVRVSDLDEGLIANAINGVVWHSTSYEASYNIARCGSNVRFTASTKNKGADCT